MPHFITVNYCTAYTALMYIAKLLPFTPQTSNCTLCMKFTLHPSLYILHPSPCILYISQCTLQTVRGVIEAQFDFSNFFKFQTVLFTTLRHLAKKKNSELVSTFERFRNSHFIFEAHNPMTKIPFFSV